MQLRNLKGSKRFSIGDGWSLHDSECNFHCIRIIYSKNKSDTLFGVTFTHVLSFPSVIVFVFLGKFFDSSFQVGGLSHSGSVRIKSFSVVVFQSKGKINLTSH